MPQRRRANLSAQPTPPKAQPAHTTARWTRVVAPVLLFATALAIRALPWPSVLGPNRTLFVGTDAYYHARRVLYGLVRFPETLEFDRYINFPHGAHPIWTPFFDFALVLSLRPFLDGSDQGALDRALVWAPPLLGAATVVATYALARKHFDGTVAVVAGVLLCVLSGHFWYSQIGFLDHHAAVALASVLLMSAGMKLVATLEDDDPSPLRLAGAAAAVGIASGACLLLWPGMLLHVALLQLGVLLLFAALPDALAAARAAASFAVANALSLALVLGFGGGVENPAFGSFSPVVLSRFQPWLFAVLAAHLALLAGLWRTGRGQSPSARVLQALCLAVALLGVSAALLPDLAVAGEDAWRWLGKREHFQSTVAESRGLFDVHGQFGVRIAETRLSRFLYLSPLALAWLARRCWLGEGSRALLLVLPWALGLGLVTLFQKRFFNSFSLPLAILMAFSVVNVARSLAARAPSPSAGRFAVPALVAIVVAWLLAPMYAAYEGPLADQWKILRKEQPERVLAGPDLRTLIRTADWMRANTPPTRGYLSDERPEYGVLALWGNGHVIEYVGRRPTVTDSFGDDIGEQNFRLGLHYFASEEEADASEVLDRLGVRYVIAESLTGGRRPGRAPSKLMEKLYEADGTGLSRHRLIFEASAEAGQAGRGPDRFKVFEHVRGAEIHGEAPPGARVRAQLAFTTNRGRRGVYRSHTNADAGGEYRLRLPYATRGGPPALITDDAYELHVDGQVRARLAIEESDIQEGREVEAPSLATLATDAADEESR
jgi:asparagine N-glycosylation enzyme membrane subunit Stt3